MMYETNSEQIIQGGYEREERYLSEKETRKKKINDAIAISTLDSEPPTEEGMNVLNEYINGDISIEQALEKTIERYKAIGEIGL